MDERTSAPPDDPYFVGLLAGAAKGIVPVFGVVLATADVRIRRFDENHRPDRSQDGRQILAAMAKAWNEGNAVQPWLYVDHDTYVVSDDYFAIALIESGKPSSFAAQVLGQPLPNGLIEKVGPLSPAEVNRMLGLIKKTSA